MRKLSQRIPPIDSVIGYLIEAISPVRLNDVTHDALLIDQFFSRLPETFQQQPEVSKEDIEEFAKSVDLRALGIKEDGTLRKQLLKVHNIDRVVDLIANAIPDDKKIEIVKKHLKEVWFDKNSNGDYNHFLNNMNWEYWGIEPYHG